MSSVSENKHPKVSGEDVELNPKSKAKTVYLRLVVQTICKKVEEPLLFPPIPADRAGCLSGGQQEVAQQISKQSSRATPQSA